MNLKLRIELPIPDDIAEGLDEQLGQAQPEIIRFLVGELYPQKPDSLPDAKVEWELV